MTKYIREVVREEQHTLRGNHSLTPLRNYDEAGRPAPSTPSNFLTVGEVVQSELLALDPAAQQEPESTLCAMQNDLTFPWRP